MRKKVARLMEQNTSRERPCYHCGLHCSEPSFEKDGRYFCCPGCVTVYEILNENEMDHYYRLEDAPGQPGEVQKGKYDYLDEEEILEGILDYRLQGRSQITLPVPSIHCASCVWLLENLYQLCPGIESVEVNFMEKKVSIDFREEEVGLSQIVSLMDSLGYKPRLNLDVLAGEKEEEGDYRRDLIRLGVAGFCFGNVMLFSFPEYLSGREVPAHFRAFFGYLSLLLSLPALFYSGWEWIKKAFLSARHGFLSLDVPIVLGLFTLFFHSSYEVLTGAGQGYFDSLCAFVFFLLIGRFFQNKTFDTLSFSRDYTSYFPLAVQVLEEDGEKSRPIESLNPGQRILVRNQELVPADCRLLSDQVTVDYSFITGEAEPQVKLEGEKILAGGRILGSAGEMEVEKKVSQSFFVTLWNRDEKGEKNAEKSLADKISPYFTVTVLVLATLSAIFWIFAMGEVNTGLYAFSSVLIVACPCALALSTPFTQGALVRLLGKNGVFLKNGRVLEKLSEIDTIVFDKTGTLTEARVELENLWGELSPEESKLVSALAGQSVHPVSRTLAANLPPSPVENQSSFREIPGQGIEGKVKGHSLRVGRLGWVTENPPREGGEGQLGISIDHELRAVYTLENRFRPQWKEVLQALGENFDLHLISGDKDQVRSQMEEVFPSGQKIHFELDPLEKNDYIKARQEESAGQVAMVGDGLNDSGALLQSDLGIVIMEKTSHFSPACDIILVADNFSLLPRIFKAGEASHSIIRWSFALSLVYNLVGLAFAITGNLTPLVAAILMPTSSLSVMLFALFGARRTAVKHDLISRKV